MPFPSEPSTAPANGTATRVRYRVVVLLCLLTFILYLDRICISQAASSIENDLKISHTEMGFVLAAFTVAYGLFQIPAGHWGDRHGSRGVLTRIVLWWSVFTALTGAATGFVMLFLVRFLFGAGEAGALPNAARVVSRWFPPDARGPAQGAVVTAALVGGALSPMVTEYLLGGLGWRWSFVALGVPGLLWAAVFWWWYRDDPAAHPQTNERERQYIRSAAAPADPSDRHPPVPWRQVLSSPNIWLLGAVITCGSFTTYMFFSWYPTYLKEGREVAPALSGWMAGLVLGGGAVGSTVGGYLSDWLIRSTGNRRWTRRVLGCCALGNAALAMAASIWCDSAWASAGWCAWACLAVHVQLASWWGAVTEVSGKHLGALFGLMNSLGMPGAVASQLFLGHFVDRLGERGYLGRARWDPAFYIYGSVLLIGALCWLFVDTTKAIGAPSESATPTESARLKGEGR
jgi:MFS transporter, ACS family, glucarate transporter